MDGTSLSPEPPKLYDLLHPRDQEAVLEEVARCLEAVGAGAVFADLAAVCRDVAALFNGTFPGFRKSDTPYHDLEHTLSVLLATARLLHGLGLGGRRVRPESALTGLVAALLHDAGFISRLDEDEGVGARYTIGHEARGVLFARGYLAARGWPAQTIEDCSEMIKGTAVTQPFDPTLFRDPESLLLGRALAAGDLLAQMADRAYLEKLLLLYREFRESGVGNYASERGLLEKTEGFYTHFAQARFKNELGSVETALRSYFRVRWAVDADLYRLAIERNIAYLKSVLTAHRDSYRLRLRRNGIVEALSS